MGISALALGVSGTRKTCDFCPPGALSVTRHTLNMGVTMYSCAECCEGKIDKSKCQ